MAVYGGGNSSGWAISYAATEDFASDFSHICTNISTNTQQLIKYVAQLQRMVLDLGTPQDCEDLRERLSQCKNHGNNTARETQGYFQDLTNLPKADTQSEDLRRGIKRDRLMKEFMNALNRFQKLQREIAHREKEELASAKRAHKNISHDPDGEEQMTEIKLDSPGLNGSPQMLQMVDDGDMHTLHEREAAIRQLEADITDVNQIFTDLGRIVHDQGFVIDNIEANIESAHTYTDQGTEELRQAREFKSKYRKKCVIFVIVVIILLTILGLILGITLSSKT